VALARGLMRAFVALAAGAFAVAALAALAADSKVDLLHSTVVATFRQQAVSVDAAFRRFEGEIDYDPALPAATRATLSVDMTSLDIGDDDTNAEVLKPAWFDTAHFPRATFKSASVKASAAGRFDAAGELTIKGRARPITVTVDVRKIGSGFAFDGSFELSRQDFNIGDPAWNQVLDDKVRVHFHLLAAGH
jgi:polyisoprenoid-binding protein YceI